ncbi:hypothetical protein T08_15857, partial [Trichinella sp. T8]
LTFSPLAVVDSPGGESKRSLLSTAFHVFDPAGCLAPFTALKARAAGSVKDPSSTRTRTGGPQPSDTFGDPRILRRVGEGIWRRGIHAH